MNRVVWRTVVAIGLLYILVGGSAETAPVAAEEPSATTSALSAARARAEAHPADAAAQKELGHAYYEAGQLPEALVAFQRALNLEPSSVDALVNVGVVLNESNRAREALGFFQRARAQAPDDVMVICNTALAHHALGEKEAAVGELLLAIEIDPQNQLAHFQLGVAFAEAGIYKEAVREWEQVVAGDSETAAAAQARANIEMIRRLEEVD